MCVTCLPFSLLQVIEPSKSTAELMGAKVELKLRKAEPFAWPALVSKLPASETNKENTSEPEKQ